jgi:hypothetical protein
MSKPDVTLQPSKGVITQAAAQIYAAYIIDGRLQDNDADQWIKRSIREAIMIARTVDASVQSDQELPEQTEQTLREPSTGADRPTSSRPGDLFPSGDAE